MSKITLNDVESGFASKDLINRNNQIIEDAFDNSLSLDGSSPNALQANIDLNGYKIINSAEPTNNSDVATRKYVNDLVNTLTSNLNVTTATFSKDEFTGDGVTTSFTLSFTPASTAGTLVWVNGVSEVPEDDYTVSGNTITFVSAPANGNSIVVVDMTGVNTGLTLGNGSIETHHLEDELQGLVDERLLSRDFEIWVVTGQSNATQKNTGGATATNTEVKAWDSSQFNTAEIGTAPFTDPSKNCIAIEFGRARQKISGKTIYLIWEAKGGRRIAYWLPWTEPTITNVTQANPAVVTYTGGSTLKEGDAITINNVSGMTELNGNNYIVNNLNTSTNTFELQDTSGTDVDSTGYSAYTLGGEIDLNYYIYDTIDNKITNAYNYLNLDLSEPLNGVLFMQGESDNSNTGLFGYRDDLVSLIERFAGETYWSKSSQFIACEVANTPLNDRANVGMALVAKEYKQNGFKLVHSKYKPTTDTVHFTGQAITEMGIEAALLASSLISYEPEIILTNSFVHDLDDGKFDDINEFVDWFREVKSARGGYVEVTLKTGSNTITKPLYIDFEGKHLRIKSSFIGGHTAPPTDADMTGTRSTDLATVKSYYDGYLECSVSNGIFCSNGTVYLDTTAIIGDSTSTAIGIDGRDQVTRAGSGTIIFNDLTVFGFDGASGKGIRVYDGLLQEANTSANLSVFHCVTGIDVSGSNIISNNLIVSNCSNTGLYVDNNSYAYVPNCTIKNNSVYGLYIDNSSNVVTDGGTITGNTTKDIYLTGINSEVSTSGTTYTTSNLTGTSDVRATSTEIALTTGNTEYAFAHSLGTVPDNIEAFIVCKTAELDYSVDDKLKIDSNYTYYASTTLYADATNVTLRQVGTIRVCSLAGASDAITPSNWRLILTAVKYGS